MFSSKIETKKFFNVSQKCFQNTKKVIDDYQTNFDIRILSCSNWYQIADILYCKHEELAVCQNEIIEHEMKRSCDNDWDYYRKLDEEISNSCKYVEAIECHYRHYIHCVWETPVLNEGMGRDLYNLYVDRLLGNDTFEFSKEDLNDMSNDEKERICCYLDQKRNCPKWTAKFCQVEILALEKLFLKHHIEIPRKAFGCTKRYDDEHCKGIRGIKNCTILLIFIIIKVWFI